MQVVIEDIYLHSGEIFILMNRKYAYIYKEIDASLFINHVPHHIDFNAYYSTFKAA